MRIISPGSSERTSLEAEVEQRHALAGGGEQRAVLGVAQRPEALGIAQHDHVAHGVQEDDVVGAVELAAQVAEHLDQVGPFVAPQLVAEVVHDDFGVECRA